MSLFGTNVTQSVAGLSQAERIEAKDKRPAEPKAAQRRTRKDEHDLVIVSVESADAVRALKDNSQEETREDRQEHSQYTPGGSKSPDHAPPRLDVEG